MLVAPFTSTKAVDNGMLVYELGEMWWSLLPHLALEHPGPEGTTREKGVLAMKDKLRQY